MRASDGIRTHGFVLTKDALYRAELLRLAFFGCFAYPKNPREKDTLAFFGCFTILKR